MDLKHPKSFIVSSGRAGSTLLQSILNSSQQIYVPRESDFIARAYPFFGKRDRYNALDYELLTRLFAITSQDAGWEMNVEEVSNHLKKCEPQSFADVFARIFELYCILNEIDRTDWAIKHPVLISSLDRISATYPAAKIVHIFRDGRDVYLSYKKIHTTSQVRFGPKGVIDSALYWVDGLRRIEEFKGDVFELSYENLIENPEIILGQLCDFLGIEYNPHMIRDYGHKNKEIPQEFIATIHRNTSKGLLKANVRKYKNAMSKIEIFIFEVIAAPYLKKLGYPLEYKFSSSFIFLPLRVTTYYFARRLNLMRYSCRDRKVHRKCLTYYFGDQTAH